MLMMLVCWGGCKVFASRQNFPADADDAGLSKVPADAHCDCRVFASQQNLLGEQGTS